MIDDFSDWNVVHDDSEHQVRAHHSGAFVVTVLKGTAAPVFSGSFGPSVGVYADRMYPEETVREWRLLDTLLRDAAEWLAENATMIASLLIRDAVALGDVGEGEITLPAAQPGAVLFLGRDVECLGHIPAANGLRLQSEVKWGESADLDELFVQLLPMGYLVKQVCSACGSDDREYFPYSTLAPPEWGAQRSGADIPSCHRCGHRLITEHVQSHLRLLQLLADALERRQKRAGAEDPRVETAARHAHELNRTWCALQGDDSQLPWEEAPAWQRKSALEGVRFHVANPGTRPVGFKDSIFIQVVRAMFPEIAWP